MSTGPHAVTADVATSPTRLLILVEYARDHPGFRRESRDAAIVGSFREGASMQDLVAASGLSPRTVQRILARRADRAIRRPSQ